MLHRRVPPHEGMTMSDTTETSVPTGAGYLPAEAFKMIVDITANPFVVIAIDGTISYAGGSIEKVVGWTPEQLAGRNITEFLPPGELDKAIEVIAEIDHFDRSGAGVPMVFEVLQPDGGTRWVEIGAMPLLDVPGVDGIVLRHRAWDSQFHFDAFVALLLADEPVAAALDSLLRSIAASLEGGGAALLHGFDGHAFADVASVGVPEACIVLDAGPWCESALVDKALSVLVSELPEGAASAARGAGFESCWTIPVPTSQGLAPAVLAIWRRSEGPPLVGHRHLLERSTRYAQLALVRTAEHQRLRHMVGHDALTGVANRVEFRDRLAHALAIGERDLAVAFCDLDRFKPMNDTFGHRVGGLGLVEVADRLRRCLRAGDELARLGGDEFTVLLRNVPDEDAAGHVAERLLASTRDAFDAGGGPVPVGLSVGIAWRRPGTTSDELRARADEALYDAKRAGGGCARVAR